MGGDKAVDVHDAYRCTTASPARCDREQLKGDR
jgi:hypothetical protein